MLRVRGAQPCEPDTWKRGHQPMNVPNLPIPSPHSPIHPKHSSDPSKEVKPSPQTPQLIPHVKKGPLPRSEQSYMLVSTQRPHLEIRIPFAAIILAERVVLLWGSPAGLFRRIYYQLL
jgi:hypothetical protein